MKRFQQLAMRKNPTGITANSGRLVWRNTLQTWMGNASEIRPEDMTSKDAIVAVMGPTGTGKSSFIEAICGIDGKSGHSLESCTQGISVVRLSFPEHADFDLCFVDTPGFDDTRRSDVEIFKMISDWLNHTYKRNIQLDGLLYFHRISDNRMGQTPLKNLRLFDKLCGKDYNRIVLTTTMWDEVDEETGSKREEELKDIYWKSMIDRGSFVKRFLRNRDSALDVLAPIFDGINKRSALLLQKEVSDLGLKLNQTAAGKTLFLELGQLVFRHQAVLERIRNELREPSLNEQDLQMLMDEYKEVVSQLQRASADKRLMHISWFQRAMTLINWIPLRRFPSIENKTIDSMKTDEKRRDVENRTGEEAGVSLLPGSKGAPELLTVQDSPPLMEEWLQYLDGKTD